MSLAELDLVQLFLAVDLRGVLNINRVLRNRKGLGTTVLTFNDAHSRPISARPRRNAIVTLETIIWLPVLAILLAAVIEMGLIMTGSMHVAAASRLGAKLAAETVGLNAVPANTIAVADSIQTSVDNYLENAGYGPGASGGVRVQHSVGGGDSQVSTGGTCPTFITPPLPAPGAVRVGICVDVTRVAPNLLSTFGYDTTGVTLEMFTTFPYEL